MANENCTQAEDSRRCAGNCNNCDTCLSASIANILQASGVTLPDARQFDLYQKRKLLNIITKLSNASILTQGSVAAVINVDLDYLVLALDAGSNFMVNHPKAKSIFDFLIYLHDMGILTNGNVVAALSHKNMQLYFLDKKFSEAIDGLKNLSLFNTSMQSPNVKIHCRILIDFFRANQNLLKGEYLSISLLAYIYASLSKKFPYRLGEPTPLYFIFKAIKFDMEAAQKGEELRHFIDCAVKFAMKIDDSAFIGAIVDHELTAELLPETCNEVLFYILKSITQENLKYGLVFAFENLLSRINANITDENGQTLLMALIKNSSINDNVYATMLDLLLNLNINIDLMDKNGSRAIDLAIYCEKPKTALKLIARYPLTEEYKIYLYNLAKHHGQIAVMNTLQVRPTEPSNIFYLYPKKVVLLTVAPSGTLGDAASAARLAKALIKRNYMVDWIIRYDKPNLFISDILPLESEWPGLVIRCYQSDTYAWNKIIEAEKTTLKNTELIISYPTIEFLTNDYPIILRFNKLTILASEYNFVSEYLDRRLPASSNVHFIYTGLGVTQTQDKATQQLKNISNIGIYLDDGNQMQSNLTQINDSWINSLFNGRNFAEYKLNNNLFFAYVNKEENEYEDRLAHFFYLCIKKSIAENAWRTIDLVAPMSDAIQEKLLKLVNKDSSINSILLINNVNEPTNDNYSPTGFTKVRLFNPFPLSHPAMLACMATCKHMGNPILITGDQSLGEAIALGVLFFYQPMPWKEDLADNLVNFAKENCLFRLYHLLNVYFEQKQDLDNFNLNDLSLEKMLKIEVLYNLFNELEDELLAESEKLRHLIPNLYRTLPDKIDEIHQLHQAKAQAITHHVIPNPSAAREMDLSFR
ncbi:MAG: hypothetical protein A3F18_01310 [Legionellales bacterium RIFCSPHIGHO2_12_FULL_37_14]|nr:MAG: hypothetical protein A3F18_01310 [Legionellales bacterium RIFCSPHIGHO2_12_FULL_37_14]